MASIWDLFVSLKLDSSQFTKGIDGAAAKTKSASSSIGGELLSMAANFATVAGAAALVGSFMRDAVDQAISAQKAQAQLNAVLTSTKSAAGMSAASINDMAISMGKLNAIDNDDIVSASNVMLTFTQIGKQVFPAAMQAALDLSVAMGQDLQSSVVQLGKALNDPITGMTALQRVGVTFSETQKKQIKDFQSANDLMSAQKVILDEINKEFGGSGAAAAETYGGQIKNLSLAYDDMAQAVGEIALPVVISFMNQIRDGINVIELLWNWQNKLNGVLDIQNTELLKTSDNYDIYTGKYILAALASGKLTKAEYTNLIQGRELTKQSKDFMTQLGMTSAFEFEASKHAGELTTAITLQTTALQYNGATGWAALPPFMQAYITKADQVYAANMQNAQAVATIDQNFKNMQVSGQKALDAIDQAKSAQQGFQQSFAQSVDAELKARGLQGKALTDAEGALDKHFGTELKWNTDVATAAKKLADTYASTGDLAAFTSAMDTKATELQTENDKLAAGLELINKQTAGLAYLTGQTWMINVMYSIQGGIPAAPNSNQTVEPGKRRGGAQEYAGGTSFIIPAGYNENFPIGPNGGASSGERVTVTPANQVTNHYNFNYSGNASAQQIQQSYQMAKLTG